MVEKGISIGFDVAYEKLVVGRKESSYLLLLTERYKDKVKELAGLVRQLFNISARLSDEELAIIGIGYYRGQREFLIEGLYVSQEGVASYDMEISLEEDEGKLNVLKRFLEGGYGDKRRKGRGKGL